MDKPATAARTVRQSPWNRWTSYSRSLGRSSHCSPTFTKLTLYDTYLLMISEGSVTLGRKIQLLKAAMGFLAAAGGTLASALIIGGGHG